MGLETDWSLTIMIIASNNMAKVMPTVTPMLEQCQSNWAHWKQLAEERKKEKERAEQEKREKEKVENDKEDKF